MAAVSRLTANDSLLPRSILFCRHGSTGVRFVEASYPPGLRVPRHHHEEAYLCLPVVGTFRESYRKRSRDGQAWSCLRYAAGEAHEGQIGPKGATIFHVELSAATCREYGDPSIAFDFSAQSLASTTGWMLQLRQAILEVPPDPLVVEALLCEVIAAATGDSVLPPYPRRWLLRVRERLADEHDPSLCLADLALDLGCHPSHLSRAFRGETGMTIGEYRRRLQIARAVDLLRSQRPCVEVAFSAGFADQSHFGRVFRTILATTPGRLQSQMK